MHTIKTIKFPLPVIMNHKNNKCQSKIGKIINLIEIRKIFGIYYEKCFC